MTDPIAEKTACLDALAMVAQLNGDPTPQEFEAFLDCINTFQPLPPGVTPEGLLSHHRPIDAALSQIQTPELQQQVYRTAHHILRSKGIDPQEAALLSTMRSQFHLDPEVAEALGKQPVVRQAGWFGGSALAGIAALIRREGDVRRLILDYALGAAIVGLIPITGGGSLEIKLLVVMLLNLKMMWDIRNLWGRPRGQDILATLGNIFGAVGAIVAGFLAWGTVIALGVVIPYVGAFAKAAAFATATWIVGQSTQQFYTSAHRPDVSALKRAFPNLIPSDQ